MKFVDNAFKYFFKNFLWLFLIFLPATAFFVFLIVPGSKTNFIFNLTNIQIDNFVEVLKAYYPYGGLSALYLILFAVLFGLTFAVFTALSEYHMRTGKHNIKESIKLVPSYILPCLIISLFLLFVSFVVNVCSAATSYLIYKLCVVDKVIKINGAWLASIFYVLFSLVYVVVSAFLLYTANHIMLNKSTMSESLGLTSLNFDKKFFSYLCSFILPILILLPLYVFTPVVWWGSLIYTLCFTLVFMYIASLNLTAFYKINNLERKDLKVYPYTYFK